MAINPNNIITYSELTSTFLNWLKTSCTNIGSDYSSSVPAYFKSSWTNKDVVKSTVNAFNPSGAATNAACGVKASIVSSTVIPVVNVSKVTSDFNSFMQARSIDTKSDKPITTRGVINFWNNVAAFCTSNILFVTGQKWGVASPTDTLTPETKKLKMYKSVCDYQPVTTPPEGELISSADVKEFLKDLEKIINDTAKTHQIVYTMTAYSSSSSSSCCSSSCSCSSSSSSSSSMFIGYMKLD